MQPPRSAHHYPVCPMLCVVDRSRLTAHKNDGADVDTEEDEAKRERCQTANAVSFGLLSCTQHVNYKCSEK